MGPKELVIKAIQERPDDACMAQIAGRVEFPAAIQNGSRIPKIVSGIKDDHPMIETMRAWHRARNAEVD